MIAGTAFLLLFNQCDVTMGNRSFFYGKRYFLHIAFKPLIKPCNQLFGMFWTNGTAEKRLIPRR